MDVEGDAAKAGKRLQKDADAGKATFVSLLGLDGARQRASDLVAEAEAALAPYGAEAKTLRDLGEHPDQGGAVAIMVGVMFIVIAGIAAVTLDLGQTSAALHVPLAYVYLVLPLSGVMIMYYTAVFLLDHLNAFRGA